MAARMQKYIFFFVHDHLDFRLAELKAVANLFNYRLRLDEENHDKKNPFLVLELPSDDLVKQILGRCILVRSVFQYWCEGETLDELKENIRAIPNSFLEPYLTSEQTFRFQVEAFNKKLTGEQKLARIEAIAEDVLVFKGKVKLKDPENSYHIMEYYGHVQNKSTEHPLKLYFGKWIADGQKDKVHEYQLKKRQFIGNTSMCAQLSLIMANLAHVCPNQIVFDPFVGTGSLLVAAASHDAYVMGTDISYLLLHAICPPSRHNQKKRAPDESIRSNLRQYGKEHLYLDVMVADASHHLMWREDTYFDVIITDPPYGIREGAKRVTGDPNIVIEDAVRDQHYPQRQEYNLSDIFKDLLNFSAKFLRKNGRLVYWFPVARHQYHDDNIPTHPCLRLVANCEQELNTKVARRLITMEKVKDFEPTQTYAQIPVDHFEDASFRQKYFSPEGSYKAEKKLREAELQKTEDQLKTIKVDDT